MQGKIGLRTVGRDNRDTAITDAPHGDNANISPFRRPTDAVKTAVTKVETKRKAAEELKPAASPKKVDPPRRSTRLGKSKTSNGTQQTLVDAFARKPRVSERDAAASTKKRERDNDASSKPSKKQRTSPDDEASACDSNSNSNSSLAICDEQAPAIPAPVNDSLSSSPPTALSDEIEIEHASRADPTAAETTTPEQHQQQPPMASHKQDQEPAHIEKPSALPASPAESPEHRPIIADTPSSPARDDLHLPPTPSSTTSAPRYKAVADHADLPKPVSASRFADRVTASSAATGGNYITTSLNPKTRMAEETETLEKLRNALDVSLTFHAGHHRVALFHNIQTMLRNSTRKNITVTHIAKILYLAPMLYKMTPKVLNQGRQTLETYQVDFGDEWTPPLTGKDLEQRKDLLSRKIKEHFDTHGEGPIPATELPKHDKIVDQKKWLETASLPSGVRDLLKFEEQRKEDEKRKEQVKKEQKAAPIAQGGSVKDRQKALLERIRAKKAAAAAAAAKP